MEALSPCLPCLSPVNPAILLSPVSLASHLGEWSPSPSSRIFVPKKVLGVFRSRYYGHVGARTFHAAAVALAAYLIGIQVRLFLILEQGSLLHLV